MSAIGRVATWVAVIALGVNALLLGAAGVVAGRPRLLLLAAVAAIAAGAVWAAWRRHLRLLEAVRLARRDLGDEARALREVVRRPK